MAPLFLHVFCRKESFSHFKSQSSQEREAKERQKNFFHFP
jgi:hypothetical protein